jgi:WD40-like Beta Propeller Repeat
MMNIKRILPGLLALICALLMVNGVRLSVLAQSGFTIERVSVASDGAEANSDSSSGVVSGDGRYIAFSSEATNLVATDANGIVTDIFLFDRQTEATTLISVSSDGTQGNSSSGAPSISADGNLIAFSSASNNLVSNDINTKRDIFVHDRNTGETTRVSVTSNGTEANGESRLPMISADGRYVVYISVASNLVGNDTNTDIDIFVHDRNTGQTTRVSVTSNGMEVSGNSQDPTISGDGRYVAFYSYASNLVGGDDNNALDIFVHDRTTGETMRASVASDGTQANSDSFVPKISANGRYVAYYSDATNLISGDTNNYGDVFVHDLQTGATTRVSLTDHGGQPNRQSSPGAISEDGRYIAFHSGATNLSAGDSDIFEDVYVYDQTIGTSMRVSKPISGTQNNETSYATAMSAGGEFIIFSSTASTFVADDTNNTEDIFVAPMSVNPPEVTPDPPDAFPRRTVFTTDTPTLTWNRISWATRYEIQVATTTNFSTSLVYEGATTGTELEHLVTQALDDRLYYWRVRGVGAGGAGNWSAADEFVVNAD